VSECSCNPTSQEQARRDKPADVLVVLRVGSFISSKPLRVQGWGRHWVDVLAVLLLRDGIVRFNRRFERDNWVEFDELAAG
jgi:hypothetical protein